MKKHFVYFYGSIKIITGSNSLSEKRIKERNQLVGFNGIEKNEKLEKVGEQAFKTIAEDTSWGVTTSIKEENCSIVPFRYFFPMEKIIKQIEDVITLNERKIKADSIGFPLLNLSTITKNEFRNYLKWHYDSEIQRFKKENCCYGHYYLKIIKIALNNKGYKTGKDISYDYTNLINTKFYNNKGEILIIYADAGM